jgi:hypothetical protein
MNIFTRTWGGLEEVASSQTADFCGNCLSRRIRLILPETCLRDHPVRLRLPPLPRGEFQKLKEFVVMKHFKVEAFSSVEGCPAGAGWSLRARLRGVGYF